MKNGDTAAIIQVYASIADAEEDKNKSIYASFQEGK